MYFIALSLTAGAKGEIRPFLSRRKPGLSSFFGLQRKKGEKRKNLFSLNSGKYCPKALRRAKRHRAEAFAHKNASGCRWKSERIGDVLFPGSLALLVAEGDAIHQPVQLGIVDQDGQTEILAMGDTVERQLAEVIGIVLSPAALGC